MLTKYHLITHVPHVVLRLCSRYVSLEGIAVMTGATGTTEDDISEEEDVHRQAANRQGKMLYI